MVLKKICVNNLKPEKRGYIIGLFVGDGYIYHDRWKHYKVNFFLNQEKDRDIAEFATNIPKKIGVSPYTTYHHGCHIMRVNSKFFYKYLSDRLDGIINEYNKKVMIGFISGLIDSDGYVTKGDIVISKKRKNLLMVVQLFCKYIGISAKLWSQKIIFNDKKYNIWRLRVATNFKYKKQYSRKVIRVYGGGVDYPS